jgi:uncharacterized protein (DUF3820 family)
MSSHSTGAQQRKQQDTKHKYLDTEIIEIQEKYDDITLSFGKYKGRTLVSMLESKDTKDYMVWLKNEFQKKDKDQRSGTVNAIIKWTIAVLDNRV